MGETELAANQKTGMTGVNGEITFGNLAQGIYLVEEAASHALTSTVDAFLVSIPMTNPRDHSGWLYDIHVYPLIPQSPRLTSWELP